MMRNFSPIDLQLTMWWKADEHQGKPVMRDMLNEKIVIGCQYCGIFFSVDLSDFDHNKNICTHCGKFNEGESNGK